jgi:hypothetical protein
MIIRAARPISISVDIKHRGWIGPKNQTSGGSTFDITKNPLDGLVMNGRRLRQILTYFVQSIG